MARSMLKLTEIINKIIIIAYSWLFILLHQGCTVTQTSKVTGSTNRAQVESSQNHSGYA